MGTLTSALSLTTPTNINVILRTELGFPLPQAHTQPTAERPGPRSHKPGTQHALVVIKETERNPELVTSKSSLFLTPHPALVWSTAISKIPIRLFILLEGKTANTPCATGVAMKAKC